MKKVKETDVEKEPVENPFAVEMSPTFREDELVELADDIADKLTVQNLIYVREYVKLEGVNGRQTIAARIAKYANPALAATRLMKRPAIRAAIKRRLHFIRTADDIKDDDISREILIHGFSSPIDVVSWDKDGKIKIKASDKLTRDECKNIASIKSTEVTDKLGQKKISVEVRWHAQEPYLRLMANIRGLTNKDFNISGELSIKALVAGIYKDADKTPFVDEDQTNPPKKK